MISAIMLTLAAPGTPIAAGSPAETPYTLPRSAEQVVQAAGGETYRILIAWPEAPPPPAGYPILYVLDGEDNFAITALTRPAMFDGIVAVSPSLWFGDGLITREAAAVKDAPPILIAEGDSAAALPAALVGSLDGGAKHDRARFLSLPGQSHGTTMLAAMEAAIRFAFAGPGR